MTLNMMPVAGMLSGKLRRDFTDALLLYCRIRLCIMRRC